MDVQTKITIVDDDRQKFFGEGPCRLLRGIQKNGSLRSAAAEMEMSYSKALKILQHAEEVLGFPLTERTTGGAAGGGSVLTEKGAAWLSRYETYRDVCIAENRLLFPAFFPETAPKTLGCVIMASGMGTRFGSNKLMASFQGVPMIQKALETTDGIFARRVVVTRHEDVAALCREQGIDVVQHSLPYRSDTIRLGLAALGNVDACLFCPGDQPLLRRSTVEALADRAIHYPGKIFRTCYGAEPGAPVLFPKWAFPELMSLPDGKGGGMLLKKYPDRVGYVPVQDAWELTDADTPEILKKLEEIAGRI